MPRFEELPRREIPKHEAKRIEEAYTKLEGTQIRSRGIQNAKAWHGTTSVPVTLSSEAILTHKKDVALDIARLKTMATFSNLSPTSPPVKSWKEKAIEQRGDLSGFWNDYQREMSDRITPQMVESDKRLATVLDMLAVADAQGNLCSRLEQWSDMLKRNAWDWSLIRQSIHEITNGIEFRKVLIEEAFGDLSPLNLSDPQVKAQADLNLALDAIASEIARQADLLDQHGTKVDWGTDFDAIRTRLTELSPRAQIRDNLRKASRDQLANGKLLSTWATHFPESFRKTQQYEDLTKPITAALDGWTKAAQQIQEITTLISAGINIDVEDQQYWATALAEAAKPLMKSIWNAKQGMSYLEKQIPRDQISVSHLVYRELANNIYDWHGSFRQKLSDPEAQRILADPDPSIRAVPRSATSDLYEPLNSIYMTLRRSKQWPRDWRDFEQACAGRLAKSSQGPQVSKLADPLATLFTQADLSTLFMQRSWPNTDPYSHTWKILAAMRTLKTRTADLLAGDIPDISRERTYIHTAVDGLSDLLLEDLIAT